MQRSDDDRRALDRVFRENLTALYRLAFTLLRQREEAEDAVQDAWLRIAGAGLPPGGVRHPRGWMFRILRNLCIDRLRARRTHLRVVSTETDIASLPAAPDGMASADTTLEGVEALSRTMKVMDRMPPDLAEILALVVVEEMSYREVAGVLEIPVGTVRSRLNRARRTLREMLAADEAKPAQEGSVR